MLSESAYLRIVSLFRDRIIGSLVLWYFAGHLPALRLPLVTAPVENLYILMPEQAEGPERVTSPPIGFVAIEYAGRFGRDPIATTYFGKFLRCDVITNDGILQIRSPIDVNRSRDVSCIVEQNVLVRFDDADIRILQVFREPLRLQQRLRVGVSIGLIIHSTKVWPVGPMLQADCRSLLPQLRQSERT